MKGKRNIHIQLPCGVSLCPTGAQFSLKRYHKGWGYGTAACGAKQSSQVLRVQSLYLKQSWCTLKAQSDDTVHFHVKGPECLC